MSVATTPRVLWIELTSKCPFDCVFCSRKMRRGAGRHMPYPLYEGLIRGLEDPRTIVLNYSGESTQYPDIIPAIGLARRQGAFVELVSALASVPQATLAALAGSGLGRLTASVHALDPDVYRQIYQYSSAADLVARLRSFAAIARDLPGSPALDFAFVAMQRNLDQLVPVGELAASLGVGTVAIFPVMRRDEIPVSFPELQAPATPGEPFRQALIQAAAQAAERVPGVAFPISNPAFTRQDRRLGRVPRPYPWPLPPDARIHSCEQNPFETTHVLSNGDVVACEVLDHRPLGNLQTHPLAEIWHGAEYRQFRRDYATGAVPECRDCIWKLAYQAAPYEPAILAGRGANAQLLRGWHGAGDGGVIWSTQQAAAVLQARPGSSSVHVSGILPPGTGGDPNELHISCGGSRIGLVANPTAENMPFGLDFPVPPQPGDACLLEFRTRHVYRPRERGAGNDQRDLGFAMMLLASNRARVTPDAALCRRIERTRRWIQRADAAGRRAPPSRLPAAQQWRPGVSILIAERDNVAELSECLEGVRQATRMLGEAHETLVVVNGSPAAAYAALRREHPAVRWMFSSAPLGFNAAVVRGLRSVRHDWTYLLNNDAVLDPGAIAPVLALRAPGVFAVGSQIFLKDPTRFREETNFTSFHFEDGLATVHDLIPVAGGKTFYAGGGASLFRTSLLRRLARDSGCYAPFYWEDVEWGWRARKLGYECLFCADSVVHHRHRATVCRHYSESYVEEIVERNRVLFQLRNILNPDLTARALEAVARPGADAARHITSEPILWGIVRMRIWNHRRALDEYQLMAGTTQAGPRD